LSLEEQGGVADVPVLGEDREEVADVVAAVAQGRLVEGQQPEAVDAEPLEVVELVDQAPEVAEAVVVAVLEAADGQLVEDGLLVPAVVRDDAARLGLATAGHGYLARRWSTWAGVSSGSRRT
jgi:hypothetical protein